MRPFTPFPNIAIFILSLCLSPCIARGLDSDGGSSSITTENTATAASIIEYMRYLQLSGVASQDCWITLANATNSPLGSCLRLNALSKTLVTQPNGTFSDAFNTYVGKTCSVAKCTDVVLNEWKGAIGAACSSEQDSKSLLVSTFNAILNNYSNMWTFGCGVTFNGTTANCASQIIATSALTNSANFLADVIKGTNTDFYRDFFSTPPCTGCMHNMYKAVNFLEPGFGVNGYAQEMGGKLSSCAPVGQSAGVAIPDWPSVADHKQPDIFNIQTVKISNSATGNSAAGVTRPMELPVFFGAMMAIAIGVGTLGLEFL